jgi:GST-like protein
MTIQLFSFDTPNGRKILIYLAEKSGFFLPRDGRERVAVMEWLMFQMGGFGPIPGQVHHFIALESEEERG